MGALTDLFVEPNAREAGTGRIAFAEPPDAQSAPTASSTGTSPSSSS